MLRLERITPDDDDWRRMEAAPDRVLFQTREWLQFVERAQGAKPVVAEVHDGAEHVGWFTGLQFRRLGVPILGSPFPGWTTATMGFNLAPEVSRPDAVRALVDFAFGPLRCAHLELIDRRLDFSDLEGLDVDVDTATTFEVDLTGGEDAVFGRMVSAARRAVRKAEKSGVTVEVATGTDFADEYHDQLREVFARQGLVPTYPVERVRDLITCLGPTGRLLLLRALAPDGRCVATGVFPAHNGTAYFWGGASRREDQHLRPNEALFWTAMRHWRERGVEVLDMGGGGEYKRRYGGSDLLLPAVRRSRFKGLDRMRGLAQTVVRRRQEWAGRHASPASSPAE